MMKSLTGLAMRFFRANRWLSLSSIISVMLSISLLITMTVFAANAEQSLVHGVQEMQGEMGPAVSFDADHEKMNLALLNQYIVVLSVLVLIVTSLLIVSNFEVFLYKNNHQLAIMRSMGATKYQMFKVVFLQGGMINFIGGLSGFLLSLVSYQFLQAWFASLFPFPIRTIDFHYGLAIAVTSVSMILIQIFMVIPAYRSGQTLPLVIIQHNEHSDFSRKNMLRKIGLGLLLTSLISILLGTFSPNEGPAAAAVLVGALLLILGMFTLLPIYLSSIFIRLLPVIKFLFGKTSFIAVKNLIPQARKNAFIILIISTLMLVAVFGSSLFETLQQNEVQFLEKQYATNILVRGQTGIDSELDPSELLSEIKDINSVKEVSTISLNGFAAMLQDDDHVDFDYVLTDLKELEEQGLLPSSPKNVHNSIVVTKDFAEKHQLNVGDDIELGLYLDSSQGLVLEEMGTVHVADIIEQLPHSISFIDALLDWQHTTYRTDFTVFDRAYISSNDEQHTLNELEELKNQYPELQINSYNRALEQSKQMFYQRWAIFIVVTIIILLSVILGVCNTLMNNIHSKRKELAILRTIFLDKKGIRQVILTQVMVYTLSGIIFGTVAGVLLTSILRLIDSAAGIYFHFPFMAIVGGVMLGVVLLIFAPFANKIANKSISSELTQDNR